MARALGWIVASLCSVALLSGCHKPRTDGGIVAAATPAPPPGPGTGVGRPAAVPGHRLAIQWRYGHSAGLVGPVVVRGDGSLLVCTADFHLLALSPAGEKLWGTDIGNSAVGAPALAADGTAYVGTRDGYLVAVAADGTMLWRVFTPGEVSGAPAIGLAGAVYFGSDDGTLYAVGSKGEVLWSHEFGTPGKYSGFTVSAPSFAPDGTLYVAAGGLHALGPDGSVRWSRPDLRPGTAPLIGPDGTLYFVEYRTHETEGTCITGMVRAASAQGEFLWEQRVAEPMGALQLSYAGDLVVATSAGVKVIHAADGTLAPDLWTRTSEVRSNVLLDADGSACYVGEGAVLHQLRGDGAEEAELSLCTVDRTRDSGSYLRAGANGLVYVTRSDGWLVALGPSACDSPPTLGPGIAEKAGTGPFRRPVGPFVQRVRYGLHDGTYSIRDFGSRGDWAGPVVPALLELLRKADKPYERTELLTTLAALGETASEAVPTLANAIGDPSVDVFTRTRLIQGLGRMGPGAKAAVPGLLPLVDPATSKQNCGQELEAAAMYALARIGADPRVLVPKLVAAMKDFPERMAPGPRSQAAQRALALVGEPAIPPLVEMVRGSDGFLREDACHALAMMDEAGLAPLTELLGDSDRAIRAAAVGGLRQMSIEGAVAPLEARAEVESDEAVSRGIPQAITSVRRNVEQREQMGGRSSLDLLAQ